MAVAALARAGGPRRTPLSAPPCNTSRTHGPQSNDGRQTWAWPNRARRGVKEIKRHVGQHQKGINQNRNDFVSFLGPSPSPRVHTSVPSPAAYPDSLLFPTLIPLSGLYPLREPWFGESGNTCIHLSVLFGTDLLMSTPWDMTVGIRAI